MLDIFVNWIIPIVLTIIIIFVIIRFIIDVYNSL